MLGLGTRVGGPESCTRATRLPTMRRGELHTRVAYQRSDANPDSTDDNRRCDDDATEPQPSQSHFRTDTNYTWLCVPPPAAAYLCEHMQSHTHMPHGCALQYTSYHPHRTQASRRRQGKGTMPAAKFRLVQPWFTHRTVCSQGRIYTVTPGCADEYYCDDLDDEWAATYLAEDLFTSSSSSPSPFSSLSVRTLLIIT